MKNNKKLGILTISAVFGFYGVANSAEISGTALGSYKSEKKKTNFYTETDLYISTSKKTKNNVTFGADFNLSLKGDGNTDSSVIAGAKATDTKIANPSGHSTTAEYKLPETGLYKITEGEFSTGGSWGRPKITVKSTDDVPYMKLFKNTKVRRYKVDKTISTTKADNDITKDKWYKHTVDGKVEYKKAKKTESDVDVTKDKNKIWKDSDYFDQASQDKQALQQVQQVTTYKPGSINHVVRSTESNVNFYAAGEMGKFEMGYHGSGSKEVLSDTFVRNAFSAGQQDLSVYENSKNSIKYTTPYIMGVQSSFSRSFHETEDNSSYGIKYAKSMSGIDIALAYATSNKLLGKEEARSIKISNKNYSISYSKDNGVAEQTFTQFYNDGDTAENKKKNSSKKVRNATKGRTINNRRFGFSTTPNERTEITYIYTISKISGIDAGAKVFNDIQSLNAKTVRSHTVSMAFVVTDNVTLGATYYVSGSDVNVWYIGGVISF